MKNSSVDHNQEKDLADGVIAREIVQEILKYGVSQFQIEKIINLLALELEDNQHSGVSRVYFKAKIYQSTLERRLFLL